MFSPTAILLLKADSDLEAFQAWAVLGGMPMYLNQYDARQSLNYSELIEPDIQKFLGYRFKTYCIEYLMSLNGTPEIPFVFTEIGKWWGNNPAKKQQEEIDVVAWNNNEEALIAECKWRNEKTGIKELEKLIMRSNLVPRSNKHLIFFPKSSYTKQAKDYARDSKLAVAQTEES